MTRQPLSDSYPYQGRMPRCPQTAGLAQRFACDADRSRPSRLFTQFACCASFHNFAEHDRFHGVMNSLQFCGGIVVQAARKSPPGEHHIPVGSAELPESAVDGAMPPFQGTYHASDLRLQWQEPLHSDISEVCGTQAP